MIFTPGEVPGTGGKFYGTLGIPLRLEFGNQGESPSVVENPGWLERRVSVW